jgi:hypothetical protein
MRVTPVGPALLGSSPVDTQREGSTPVALGDGRCGRRRAHVLISWLTLVTKERLARMVAAASISLMRRASSSSSFSLRTVQSDRMPKKYLRTSSRRMGTRVSNRHSHTGCRRDPNMGRSSSSFDIPLRTARCSCGVFMDRRRTCSLPTPACPRAFAGTTIKQVLAFKTRYDRLFQHCLSSMTCLVR